VTIEAFNQSGSSPPPTVRQLVADPATRRRRAAALYRQGLRRDQVDDAIQDGTIRALTTQAVPAVPTLAWIRAVDRSARLDAGRKAARMKAGTAAMTALQVILDRATLPAKGLGLNPEFDPNDDPGDGDGRHEGVWLDGDGADVRYLPADALTVHIARPDEALEGRLDDEHRLVLAEIARARLDLLAQEAGVAVNDMALVARRYGAVTPRPWGEVAKGVGRKVDVKSRVEAIHARLRAAAGPDIDVVLLLQRAELGPHRDAPTRQLIAGDLS
jgi:hypothetical protein